MTDFKVTTLDPDNPQDEAEAKSEEMLRALEAEGFDVWFLYALRQRDEKTVQAMVKTYMSEADLASMIYVLFRQYPQVRDAVVQRLAEEALDALALAMKESGDDEGKEALNRFLAQRRGQVH